MPVEYGSSKSQNKAAQKSFLHGERSFRAYLAGGNVRFLETAKGNFQEAIQSDGNFDLARFYLGVTQTQLRETNESIPVFEELLHEGKTFGGQIGLQLAYAHIKAYKDEHLLAAESELDRVIQFAENQRRPDLKLQAESLKVFLYSVMAGRYGIEEKRTEYAKLALELGGSILRVLTPANPELANSILFETYNGLGIVWMRIGQARWPEFGPDFDSWAKSQEYYDLALSLRPNAVRVLQNIATLRLLQSKRAEKSERAALLRHEAKSLYLQSLEINDHDQFPFYELAKIAVMDRDRQAALQLIQTGMTKPGAVKAAEWEEVLRQALALPIED